MQNRSNILDLLEINSNARLLDLGCDDGQWTMELSNRISTKEICGVELVNERINTAKLKGIKVTKCDLNSLLPFKNNFINVIHANQIIEHLHDTDNFISEIHRILKPGGYAIISSENLSSWHNIFALILGFQPFSMTNFSNKGNIGNPFALWKNKKSDVSGYFSWQHNRLFSYFGLKDIFKKHGFFVEKIKTAGYYPLFAFLSKIDPIHGHWITIKVRKVK